MKTVHMTWSGIKQAWNNLKKADEQSSARPSKWWSELTIFERVAITVVCLCAVIVVSAAIFLK